MQKYFRDMNSERVNEEGEDRYKKIERERFLKSNHKLTTSVECFK